MGPDGATTAEKGMPATVVMKIVENENTAANLLAAGDINAAQVIGPDAKRLEAQKLFSYGTPALQGEQWYNHDDGHATSDPTVRMAPHPGARPRRARVGLDRRSRYAGHHPRRDPAGRLPR